MPRSPNANAPSHAHRGCGKAANDSLAALRRGDIITITHGRRGGLAVVLEPDRDGDDPRPLVLTENRWAGRISSADYSGASAPLGSMSLPKRVEHRQPRVRRDVASALRSAAAGLATPPATRRWRSGRTTAMSTPNWRRCASNCVAIPPTACRTARPRSVAERYLRIERDNAQIRQKVAAATNSLARTFDRIVALLTERGFIEGDRDDPRVTDDGGCWPRSTASDLLVAECLRSGAWNGLEPAELAAVLSAVLYESRGDAPGAPQGIDVPTGKLRRALNQTRGCGPICVPTSSGTGSPRAVNPTTVSSPRSTAGPGDLTSALAASDAAGWAPPRAGEGSALSAGDFVRWCRQVLDLLDQVRNAAPTPALRAAAKRAVNDIRRGVVAVDAG